MGAWEMAELVKGLHKLESLSSLVRSACCGACLWSQSWKETDEPADLVSKKKAGERLGKVPNKNLWPPHACTPACAHRGLGEGGGQNGEIICSIIVLLAKKTERPEDSKNRQISVKTKNLVRSIIISQGIRTFPLIQTVSPQFCNKDIIIIRT